MDTLYDYYKSKGQSLPSVSDRASTASSAGIQDYKGTAEQNNALLSYLKKQDTVSPAVVNSSAAQQDYNNIQSNYADITKSMAQQQQALQNQQAVAQTTQQTTPATTQTVTPTAPKQTTSPIVSQAPTGADYTSLLGKSSYNPKTNTYGILQSVTPSGTGYAVNFEGQNTQFLTQDEARKLGYTADQVAQEEMAATETRKMAEANKVMQQINDIQSGVIPLNEGQLAQVQALQRGFENIINQQTLLNTGAQGGAYMRGFQTGAAEYDPTFNVKTIGSIVSAGNNKLADLNIQMAGAISQMTEAFKTSNIEKVKASWDMYQKTAEEHKATLQKVIDDTQKQIKEANDRKIAAEKVYYDTVTKPIQDIYTTLAQTPGVPPQVIANVSKANTVSEAVQAAGNYLQKGAGDIGDYLLYRNQAQGLGLTPMTYDAWKAKTTATKAKTTGGGTSSATNIATPYGANASAVDKLLNATAGLKLNGEQSKSLAFAQRAINADKALRDKLKTYDPTTIFSAAGRLLNTDNANEFARDLTDFITAVLRKESGATITEDEFKRFIPLYSPQGILTNQKDVQQTNQKRQSAIVALMSEAGGAGEALRQYQRDIESSAGGRTTEEQILSIGDQYPELREPISKMETDGVSYEEILNWANQQI